MDPIRRGGAARQVRDWERATQRRSGSKRGNARRRIHLPLVRVTERTRSSAIGDPRGVLRSVLGRWFRRAVRGRLGRWRWDGWRKSRALSRTTELGRLWAAKAAREHTGVCKDGQRNAVGAVGLRSHTSMRRRRGAGYPGASARLRTEAARCVGWASSPRARRHAPRAGGWSPISAIASWMSFQQSFLLSGSRSRLAGWYVTTTLRPARSCTRPRSAASDCRAAPA